MKKNKNGEIIIEPGMRIQTTGFGIRTVERVEWFNGRKLARFDGGWGLGQDVATLRQLLKSGEWSIVEEERAVV